MAYSISDTGPAQYNLQQEQLRQEKMNNLMRLLMSAQEARQNQQRWEAENQLGMDKMAFEREKWPTEKRAAEALAGYHEGMGKYYATPKEQKKSAFMEYLSALGIEDPSSLTSEQMGEVWRNFRNPNAQKPMTKQEILELAFGKAQATAKGKASVTPAGEKLPPATVAEQKYDEGTLAGKQKIKDRYLRAQSAALSPAAQAKLRADEQNELAQYDAERKALRPKYTAKGTPGGAKSDPRWAAFLKANSGKGYTEAELEAAFNGKYGIK